jgi:hypothetical protein
MISDLYANVNSDEPQSYVKCATLYVTICNTICVASPLVGVYKRLEARSFFNFQVELAFGLKSGSYVMNIAANALADRSSDLASEDAPAKGKRVHLALPQAIYDLLKEVQKESRAETLTDVIRAALFAYLALVKEHKKGKEIIVRSPEGKETSYALFMRA